MLYIGMQCNASEPWTTANGKGKLSTMYIDSCAHLWVTGVEERDAVPLQPHQHQVGDDHPAEVHASLLDPYRAAKILAAGAVAGAVSRTATAPIDRVKMLLQVQDGSSLSIAGAFRQMRAESAIPLLNLPDSYRRLVLQKSG